MTASRLRVARQQVADLEAEIDAIDADKETGPALPRSLQAAEKAVRTVIGTAVRVREQGVGGMLLSSIDDLSRWATEDRSEIARLAAADGSVTIFFSDIEGSTALNSELGDATWVQLLIAHDTPVRAHVDSLSTERSRVQRRTPIRVRIGIHEGTAIARNGDYFGQAVVMAARVGAEADGGEILLTHDFTDDLREDARFALSEQRTATLKGIPGEHTLWRAERAGRRA